MDHTEGGRGRFLQRCKDHINSGWWEEVAKVQIMIAKALEALRGIQKQSNIVAGQAI
jgi:hypothetical protein